MHHWHARRFYAHGQCTADCTRCGRQGCGSWSAGLGAYVWRPRQRLRRLSSEARPSLLVSAAADTRLAESRLLQAMAVHSPAVQSVTTQPVPRERRPFGFPLCFTDAQDLIGCRRGAPAE
jgi:hypothetical protein